MEATCLGLRPSLASPLSSLSRTRVTSRSLQRPSLRAPPLFRALAEQDEGNEAERTGTGGSFSNLTTEELEDKLGKRRRVRKEKPLHQPTSDPKPAPKDWDSMTLAEKAWELYVGEKGALFWLNKFAYASIFVLVGGWIFFRFVGPALNLYQLESPLLPPDQMFSSPK